MDVISVYNDFLDRAKPEQNGAVTITEFNRKSRIAELRLLDYISGDVSALQPPAPYLTQKNRDWLNPLIEKFPTSVSDGKITKPENYYQWDNGYIIGSYKDTDLCGETKEITGTNTPITLLDGAAFEYRCNTYIKRLKPSYRKPIAKGIGKEFHFMPKDLGSITIEYVRYPVFGEIKVKIDQTYNEEVPDAATSIHYEWGEFAREWILFFVTQQYPIGTREKSLVEQNEIGGKLERK